MTPAGRPATHIRTARGEECEALARLAWQAKAAWGYSAAQLEQWRAGLAPTPASIARSPTFVAEAEGGLAGFSQLDLSMDPVELAHLWVHPRCMRQGVGRALLAACAGFLSSRGTEVLHIDADPHAEPFYLACGAVRIGEIAAPIEGQPQRARPQLRLAIARRA
jgi:GNAT superfamily N-acetyltransferase